MATIICKHRGFNRSTKGDRCVNHTHLWVSDELTNHVPRNGPLDMIANFSDMDYQIDSRWSSYTHDTVTLDSHPIPNDDLLTTFNDATFR